MTVYLEGGGQGGVVKGLLDGFSVGQQLVYAFDLHGADVHLHEDIAGLVALLWQLIGVSQGRFFRFFFLLAALDEPVNELVHRDNGYRVCGFRLTGRLRVWLRRQFW